MISQKSLSFVPEQSVFESKVSPPFFYASVIIFGLLFGLLLPAHILQRDTYHGIDSIHMVRPGLSTPFFSVQNVPFFLVLLKNVPFFSILFLSFC